MLEPALLENDLGLNPKDIGRMIKIKDKRFYQMVPEAKKYDGDAILAYCKSTNKFMIIGMENGKYVECKAGNGLGYILPQKVDVNNIDGAVDFKFRVRTPMENKKIVVKLNDEVIRSVVRPHLLPAEMETISIKKELFNATEGELVIDVEDR